MERIYVTVRARPLTSEETKSSPWRISGNAITYNTTSPSKFEFDRIFGEECETRQVYEAKTKDIVSAAVRGFNGTVFAYGQTNSGKTHTMRGSGNEPGVIPLAVRDLFNIIQEVPDREFLLRMSYMEIYNEEINDLLIPDHRRLQIHESLDRGIYVAGLREEIVASPDQVLDLMAFGEAHRHIGETNMNLHSSRSHTIFRMIIESRNQAEDEESSGSCDAVRVSVLNLVDLAGSERAAKTGAEGVRLKEGSHINKSLMTLGTVIKKLSEGAESQGGHVPYRDSKLTRILQPALGGNANTAIICNITLAQLHADETKSSLQFASRALRVTNCARVNEVLTDAALLKRQKKEIEELRGKLQASHSEHLEEEILSLRNTLLQTELERERIALELEEEKKAQVEREKRLEEQEKKIKNLSSMVLYSNREEIRVHPKKDKRRDTWCPGKLNLENSRDDARDMVDEQESQRLCRRNSDRRLRQERESMPLVPFEELADCQGYDDILGKQKENQNDNIDDYKLPDPCTLLKVTNRKKISQKKKSSPEENDEFHKLQSAYEDLLLKFEAQKIICDVQIDCYERKLKETSTEDSDYPIQCHNASLRTEENSTVDTDPMLLVRQLQEQIQELESEKLSNSRNLESIIDLAKQENIRATEKYEELYDELQNAKMEASLVYAELNERHAESMKTSISNTVTELQLEVQQTSDDIQTLRTISGSISSVTDEAFHILSYTVDQFSDFRNTMSENSVLVRSVFSNYGTLINRLKDRINELENDKLMVHTKVVDLEEQLRSAQESGDAITALSQQYDLEKSELLSHIEFLERENYSLSSAYLSKENEALRKDVEKTKTKLKETESKLKNFMHDKTRLEGEKANAEREIKRLHNQKALLERDISKRDSIAGRRRDSVVDRPKAVDPKRPRGGEICLQTLQEDYKKLEVLAFEMEATIAALEEELGVANQEKDEMLSRNDSLSSELEILSEELNTSNTELNTLRGEILDLKVKLDSSDASHQKSESHINFLKEEKEEIVMQLTNALLELEEERAVWSAKEKASINAIKENGIAHNTEISSLSDELSKVRNDLLLVRKENEALQERLKNVEEDAKSKSSCSMEKSSEIDQLRHALEVTELKKRDLEAMLKSQLQIMAEERDKLKAQVEEMLANDAEVKLLTESSEDRLFKAEQKAKQQARTVSELEHKMHQDEVENNKLMAKLRMRLRSTQAKLDAFRERYKEATEEQDFMHKKFEEASSKLKERVASYGIEVMNLRKQLASCHSKD